MVMQRAVDFLVGGSNPGEMTMPPPPPRKKNTRSGIRMDAALPFDQHLYGSILLPHCLEPSKRKLLTPPPTPPIKKVISSFRG